jgi:hypothetical protein
MRTVGDLDSRILPCFADFHTVDGHSIEMPCQP